MYDPSNPAGDLYGAPSRVEVLLARPWRESEGNAPETIVPLPHGYQIVPGSYRVWDLGVWCATILLLGRRYSGPVVRVAGGVVRFSFGTPEHPYAWVNQVLGAPYNASNCVVFKPWFLLADGLVLTNPKIVAVGQHVQPFAFNAHGKIRRLGDYGSERGT